MNGSRTAAVFAPGGQGFGAQGFKQRTTITGVVDIDEDDDTDGVSRANRMCSICLKFDLGLTGIAMFAKKTQPINTQGFYFLVKG